MKGTKLKRLVEIAASACACAVLSMQPASAATINWVDTTGFWDVTGNWDIGIPTAADDAIINVGGTHTITVRSIGGPFTVNSISMTGNETLAITGNTILTVNSASTLNALTHAGGILTGTGNVTVTGNALLSNGTHQGTGQTLISNTATGTLSGNFFLNSGRQLVNNSANLNANSGFLDLNSASGGGSGSLTNNGSFSVNPGTSQLFQIFATNWGVADNGGDALFTNAGTLVKNGVGTLFVDTQFTNAGVVTINEGEVNLRRASTHQSGSSISGAGTLVLNDFFFDNTGPDHVFQAGSTVNTNVRVEGGTTTVAGRFTAANLAMQGGVLDLSSVGNSLNALTHTGGILTGTGNVTVTGTATLNGGSHRGAGQTIIGNTATGTLGSNFDLDSGRQLVNNSANLSATTGNFNLNSSSSISSGSLINNGSFTVNPGTSSFRIFADNWGVADNGGDALFTNAGTLVKNGVGTLFVDTQFTNAGTTQVQAGSVQVRNQPFNNTGTINVASGATFNVQNVTFSNDGMLQGNGTYQTLNAATALVNAGTLSPGVGDVGALTISGDYTQTAAGFFDVELTSLTSFDTLNVLGDISLNGTLRVFNLGGFNPADGDMFTIATFDDGIADASDLTGVFSNLVWSGFDPSISFTASYFDHSIVLNASTVPVPPAVWLLGSGILGLIGIARRRIKT